MRCRACDAPLSDLESTRRSTHSGTFVDMCARCFPWIQPVVETVENFLLHDERLDDLTTDIPGLSGGDPYPVDNFPDKDEYDSTDDRG